MCSRVSRVYFRDAPRTRPATALLAFRRAADLIFPQVHCRDEHKQRPGCVCDRAELPPHDIRLSTARVPIAPRPRHVAARHPQHVFFLPHCLTRNDAPPAWHRPARHQSSSASPVRTHARTAPHVLARASVSPGPPAPRPTCDSAIRLHHHHHHLAWRLPRGTAPGALSAPARPISRRMYSKVCAVSLSPDQGPKREANRRHGRREGEGR